MGEAVETTFETTTSEKKILQEAAMILRHHIQQGYSSSQVMPWPPSAAYLESSDAIYPPELLINFLTQVISGKSVAQPSNETVSLSTSITEDICSADLKNQACEDFGKLFKLHSHFSEPWKTYFLSE